MKVLLLSILGLFLWTSCTKKGCSDPLADNYDSNVKKAKNSECEYNIPRNSPCGNQVEFCAQIDTLQLSGGISLTEFDNSILLSWKSDTGSIQQLDVEIFGVKEGNFTANGSGEAKSFQVTYVTQSGTAYESEGSMKVSGYNDNVGLNAFFEVDLTDGRQLRNGYFYRVK